MAALVCGPLPLATRRGLRASHENRARCLGLSAASPPAHLSVAARAVLPLSVCSQSASRAAAPQAAGARRPRSSGACSASAALDAPVPAVDALKNTFLLTLLFVVWYGSNIFFNLWNKQLLKAYAFPMTGTMVHLAIGSLLACLMWLLRVKQPPKARPRPRPARLASPRRRLVRPPFLTRHPAQQGPAALCCPSRSHPRAGQRAHQPQPEQRGGVVHAHHQGASARLPFPALSQSLPRLQALEPFFSVMMSWAFLGAVPSAPLVLTLIPIVLGVILASVSVRPPLARLPSPSTP